MLVTPPGGKLWRFKYRINGAEKLLALGKYPEVSLRDARARRDDARRLRANDVDPSAHRKAVKAAGIERNANSFEVVTREWFEKSAYKPAHGGRILARFERDIFPWIGDRPVADLTVPDLLGVLKRIEARGALETAHRALGDCQRALRYAIQTGRATHNVSADLGGALKQSNPKHFASVTEPKRVGQLMRIIRECQAGLVVRSAVQLAPLIFVRPIELRHARWAEIDLDVAEWRFLVTKTQTQHIVPLATQAVAILRDLKPLTGGGEYVFPNGRRSDRPMSENGVLSAMRDMGISAEELTPHGFRAMARTMLDEQLKVRPDLIEHQLAHAVRDANGRAYNRTAFVAERRDMMQRWANYLDSLVAQASP